MALLADITNDVKTALKAGDSERAGILRFVIAQIKNREIEKRTKEGGDGALTEDETMDVMRKEIKKRRDAVELYRTSGHEDVAEKEEKEIALIQSYLPAAPSEADIRKVIAEIKAGGITDFGAIMKAAREKLKGADGALVSKIAKE
jgi:uncharacterized protein YqeY